VLDRQRHSALPQTKTFAEMGIPNLDVTIWWGLMGQSGLPAEIVQRLNATLNEALGSASMREALGRLRANSVGGGVEVFAQRLSSESRSWGEVIRTANIKAS